jgi:hypothetical protein
MITGVHAVLFSEDAEAVRVPDDIEAAREELTSKRVEFTRPR